MTDTASSRVGPRVRSRPRADETAERTRFRPSSRRWNRIALGVALIAVAIGGNVLVYSTLNRSQPVVQVVQDVPAGTRLTEDMLRPVDASIDSSVNAIPGERLEAVVGTYARVRLASGSLVSEQSLQSTPLVTDGAAIIAVQVADGAVPIGLRERVPVQLVIPPTGTLAEDPSSRQPVAVSGRVVGLPVQTANALGTLSLSVEVTADDAAMVAAADDVRVVLLAPTSDPAAGQDVAPDHLLNEPQQSSPEGDG